jgi:L-cystine uptake protein TcyP (sodium:dicarboxylate symporter family)
MKTKKSDMISKIFLTAVIVVLVGLLIAWMMGVFKDKKQDINSSSVKIDSAISSVADFDLIYYEDKTIDGESLVKLIKDVVSKGPELSIEVQTLVNAKKTTPVIIYYNKFLGAGNVIDDSGKNGKATALDQSSKSSDNYITPTASFRGEILKNSNNEIMGILFTQQK